MQKIKTHFKFLSSIQNRLNSSNKNQRKYPKNQCIHLNFLRQQKSLKRCHLIFLIILKTLSNKCKCWDNKPSILMKNTLDTSTSRKSNPWAALSPNPRCFWIISEISYIRINRSLLLLRVLMIFIRNLKKRSIRGWLMKLVRNRLRRLKSGRVLIIVKINHKVTRKYSKYRRKQILMETERNMHKMNEISCRLDKTRDFRLKMMM